jgi:nucleoid-associated protein YgaU
VIKRASQLFKTTLMEQTMTSAGKLIIGTLIVTAAVATAKYLHEDPMPAPPVGYEQAPAEKLTWRNAPLNASPGDSNQTAPALQLTSAQEVVESPASLSPIVDYNSRQVGSFESAASTHRPPLPFSTASVSRAKGGLTTVDDEEIASEFGPGNFVHHTVQFGETLPQIAMQYTGRQDTYLLIYHANLDVLKSPADLSPGIVLKIPVR